MRRATDDESAAEDRGNGPQAPRGPDGPIERSSNDPDDGMGLRWEPMEADEVARSADRLAEIAHELLGLALRLRATSEQQATEQQATGQGSAADSGKKESGAPAPPRL